MVWKQTGTVVAAILVVLGPARASAAAAPPAAILAELARGGCVVVLRHAHAPADPPARDLDPGNADGERQLDSAGKAEAARIGSGVRALAVRVGPVFSSPTYRALQTARLAGLGEPVRRAELGDGGASMAAAASGETGDAWLRAAARKPPPPGADVFILTQGPNLTRAFGVDAADMADGEALVFRPDGRGGSVLVGRLKVEAWPAVG